MKSKDNAVWVTRRPGTRVPAPRRPAFSLAELVVAIGLLVLMISLAGQVMSLTTQTTGHAKALTEVNQLLRALEETIREDLRNVRAGESMIFIQGNAVNAYWTANGRTADNDSDPNNGYPHPSDVERTHPFYADRLEPPRADILMIFTSRRAASFIDPKITSQLQQVVYGHAELGEYVDDINRTPPYRFRPNATVDSTSNEPAMFPADPNRVAPIPAEDWHLARRSVLLLPVQSPQPAMPPWENDVGGVADPDFRLSKESLLLGQSDVVANFDFAGQVLVPSTLPGGPGEYPLGLPAIFDPTAGRTWSKPYARSRLDATAPPELATRLGAYFVPRCASFKVEWSLDPKSSFVGGRLDGEKRLYWFDPGALKDPARPSEPPNPMKALEDEYQALRRKPGGDQTARWLRLDELLFRELGGPPGESYSMRTRFRNGEEWRNPNLTANDRINANAFVATRRDTNGTIIPEDVFPAALRITVDVFDSARRLARPIRHVIVVPVGDDGTL